MKKKLFPRVALVAAILVAMVALALPLASHAKPQSAEFMITNKSDWDIHELYISPTHKNSWGPDQLGEKVIKHGGGTYTINKIPCGSYDIKVVDEDGDDCIVEDIRMCKDHTHWDLTNKELANCEGWGD